MATNNSINLSQSGIVNYNGTGTFTGVTVTQHDLLIGAAANSITSVAPSATAGIPVVSAGAASDPVFGTTVVAGGGTGLATLTAFELLAAGTTSTGNVQQIGLGSSGQVLTSNGAGALASYQPVAGTVTWVDVSSGSQTIAVGTGYVTDNATLVTYTLPATAAFGSVFEITGGVVGVGGWTIAQNAAQQMHLGSSATTAGVTGSVSSTNQYDGVKFVAVVAGASTIWTLLSSQGNLTIV